MYVLTAYLVFAVAVVGSIGISAYEWFLSSEVEELAVTLQDPDEAFDPDLLEELEAADAVIRSAEQAVNDHVASTFIFNTLEELTAENIFFSRFEYHSHQITEGDNTRVVLSGSAPTFGAVAFQSDVLEDEDHIEEVIVRDVSLEEGRVIFTATLIFPSESVLFSETL